MEYHGRLFGKIGNKYFDTGSTSDEFDSLQKRVKELEAKLKKVYNVNTEKGASKSFCRCGILAAYAPNGSCDICGLQKEPK